MKRPAQKTVTLAIGIVAIMLMAGCEEQSLSSVKKHRLIADENIQLKKELEQCNKEVEKYLQEKATLEEQIGKGVDNMMETVLKDFVEQNEKLSEENRLLKAQVEKIQKENDNLKVRIRQLEKELEGLKEPTAPEPL